MDYARKISLARLRDAIPIGEFHFDRVFVGPCLKHEWPFNARETAIHQDGNVCPVTQRRDSAQLTIRKTLGNLMLRGQPARSAAQYATHCLHVDTLRRRYDHLYHRVVRLDDYHLGYAVT